ncbi:type II secretion system protein [Deinococcus sp. 14RED07]|uniref:type II secretion system protein n=1 Tax=unclassified Deinococcus TaxID=2623546 RepID=UPI001E3629A5|nr:MULTISPECIES: type II secretion system protein [unclassified Deinococcus]MCD0157269.1 type II secretion system protein [Deinococcus sp. 6GRE01]MCD0175561.1 type II secretion system protein [Deinococcus sp. 14RED07]
MDRKTQGFTLLEVLVSIALLAVVLAMVSASLTGLFRSNRQSEQRQNNTVRVQELAEDLRRHWLDPSTMTSPAGTRGDYRLARACTESFTVPTGMTVTVWDVTPNTDGTFTVSSSYSLNTNCGAATERPANSVRRVRVQSSSTAGPAAELTFEMYGG